MMGLGSDLAAFKLCTVPGIGELSLSPDAGAAAPRSPAPDAEAQGTTPEGQLRQLLQQGGRKRGEGAGIQVSTPQISLQLQEDDPGAVMDGQGFTGRRAASRPS